MRGRDPRVESLFHSIISIIGLSNTNYHNNNSISNTLNFKMQFAATILAFAAAAVAAPSSQCTFGQYVCSKDGLSILQCDITGKLVVSNQQILSQKQRFMCGT